ncbi:MAG TPA: helix-turn-helix domain-containing protein [Nitrososphaera sp.]
MPDTKSAHDNDLPGSLEEFGLSKYEARAYLTIIGKGSLAASEIAYYANLPRTKVYQTIKKLEKKRLAVISQQKPLICSAIPPEEAFAELLRLHERRVKNMKKIIDQLQKLNDEGQRPKGSEERRYFVLDPNATLEKVSSLIGNSRSSVVGILDPWGVRLMSQCRSSLVRAITNSSKVRIIIGKDCIGSENLYSLLEGIDLKVAAEGAVSSNLLIIDSTHLVSIDSNNGRAALFSSADSFGVMQAKNFEQEWERAMEMKNISQVEPSLAKKAIELAGIVENGLGAKMLEYAMSGNNSEIPAELVDLIDKKHGLKISSMSPPEVIDLVDSALRITCLGGIKHDKANNILSLQSKIDRKHPLPWALVLASYFKHAGIDPRIMQSNNKGAQLIHLRLATSVST